MIISAPFGNYLNFPGCISTIGTFTAESRKGTWWKVLTTVRYNRRQNSWINKIGLRNPGIGSVSPKGIRGKIVSIHGFDKWDWWNLSFVCERLNCSAVEFNLSCPNVESIRELPLESMKHLIEKGISVIVKLPPIQWMRIANPCYNIGVKNFHCCNTIPTPGGGISGKPLMQYSLWCIEEMRKEFPDSHLIGGGGITSVEDVRKYKSVGANDVAVGSMLFNPFSWKLVPKLLGVSRE